MLEVTGLAMFIALLQALRINTTILVIVKHYITQDLQEAVQVNVITMLTP